MCTLTTLKFLDLGRNNLSGDLPAWLGNLRNLETLYLHGNDLGGEIPGGLGHLPLRVMHLHDNQKLAGCLPYRLESLNAWAIGAAPGTHGLPSEFCPDPRDLENERSVLVDLFKQTRGKTEITGEVKDRLRAMLAVHNRVPTKDTPDINNSLLNWVGHKAAHYYDFTLEESVEIEITARITEDDSDIGIELYLLRGVHGVAGVGGEKLHSNTGDGNNPTTLSIEKLAPGFYTLEVVADGLAIEVPFELAIKLGGDGENDIDHFLQTYGVGECHHDVNFRTEARGIITIKDKLKIRSGCYSAHGIGDDEIIEAWGSRLQYLRAELIAPEDVNPGGADYIRELLGWINHDGWLSDKPIGEWHGVTTNEDESVIGIDLSDNNLIGQIPQGLADYLPNLQWLGVGGNSLSGCISSDLLRPMLIGDFVSLRPDAAKALQDAGEDLSTWSNEELYNDLMGTGQANETPWGGLYRTTLLNHALEAVDEQVPDSISKKTKDAVQSIPADLLKSTPKYTFKYFGKGPQAKLVGPFIKIANRMIGYTAIKHQVTLCAPPPPAPPNVTDREALLALFNATNGHGWDVKDGWLSDKPIGEWYGVHTENGRVTKIDLSFNVEVQPDLIPNFIPFVPIRIDSDVIVHPGNGLSGPIPPELGSLSELKYLNLSKNDLSGPIPPELGNLRKLEVLALNDNQLTNDEDDDPIPPELGNLNDELEEFNVQGNKLVGWLPQELGMLSLLGDLRKMDMDRGALAQKQIGDDVDDVTVDCVGGLCGCLPANPDLVAHDELLGIVNTGVVTALTWPIGGPVFKAAGLATKFAITSVVKGQTRALSWSLSFRIANGAGKYQIAASRIGIRGLGVLDEAVIKGQKLSKFEKIAYVGIATVLTENALGAFAEPVAKVNKWWDPEIVGPVKERAFNLIQDVFRIDVGGDIVMEGVWCMG